LIYNKCMDQIECSQMVEQDDKGKERDLVAEDPEKVGLNFDHEYIIDGRDLWPLEKHLKYIEERDGSISDDINRFVESGEAQKFIEESRKRSESKKTLFTQYLLTFNGRIKHVRINPGGELSPLSPSQAIEYGDNDSFNVSIPQEFINQIKELQKWTEDITLVIPFYDHRRGKEESSNVPESPSQVEEYIAICKQVANVFGNKIQLEIGNETNVSRTTGSMFSEKLQHSTHVDTDEYGEFFFNVARAVKSEYPSLRMSMAGVACFDPTYIKEVVAKVTELQEKNGINSHLIDTISFHPYRDNPSSGSVEVKNGSFVRSDLNYEQQMEEMQKIASDIGAVLTVGEINFSSSDPLHFDKLKEAISVTKKKGIVSYIYPGIHVY